MANPRFSSGYVFAAAAIYCLIVGLLIQLFVLPVMLPHIHAGNGLLKGGDWIGYHAEGAALAARIQLEGWTAWDLRPRDNAAIGIVAAIYAITGIHQPWIVLPLNSLLFATGAACLYGMFVSVTPRRAALAGVLPYLLFPSAALQFAQITKDVWTVAGSLLICFSFVELGRTSPLGWRAVVKLVVLATVGAVLIWIVRPYQLEMLLPGILAMVLILAIGKALFGGQGKSPDNATRGVAVALCLLAVCSLPLLTTLMRQGVIASGATLNLFSKDPVQDLIGSVPTRNQIMPAWQPTTLPAFIDSRIRLLAQYRVTFINIAPEAGSFVDPDVRLTSVGDMLRYIPRAIQIGVLAPFPDTWFTTGVNPGSGLMRSIAGLEMAATYVLLLGLIAFWAGSAGRRTQVVMIGAFSLSILCLMAFIFSNLGTLYRLRYPYLQTFVGLGAAGWLMILRPRIEALRQVLEPAR